MKNFKKKKKDWNPVDSEYKTQDLTKVVRSEARQAAANEATSLGEKDDKQGDQVDEQT